MTSITIGFNEALDPISATNQSLYALHSGVKKHGRTVFSKVVGIRGVTYDSIHNTLTINLAKPFKGLVQVTVSGTIMALDGTPNTINFSKVVA